MKDLKPCPFCGNEEVKFKRMNYGLTEWYFITCVICRARVQHVTRQAVIDTWNNRVTQ